METEWSKVLEVFVSGIVGVFLVMFLVQLLTQLSTKIIDIVENWKGADAPRPEQKGQAVSAKR